VAIDIGWHSTISVYRRQLRNSVVDHVRGPFVKALMHEQREMANHQILNRRQTKGAIDSQNGTAQ
jgi:hypothetical protein